MSILSSSLESFTDAELTNLSDTVYANGWQNEGGVMPFADALGTFRNLLSELRSADAEALIEGMPHALQQTIQSRLANIRTYITNTISGTCQLPNFADEVDRLHLDTWQGGFRFKGTKVLGYEAKYKQVSEIAKELERVRESESEARELLAEISSIRDEVKASEDQLTTSKTSAEQQIAGIDQIYAKYEEADANLSTVITNVESKLIEASESAATAEAKAQSAGTHEKRLMDFTKRVDENEKRMSEILQESSLRLTELEKKFDGGLREASSSIDKFKAEKSTELNSFIERLKVIEDDINEKLRNATGITLFHAFEARGKKMWTHWVWLGIAALVLAVVVGVTAYCVSNTTNFDAAFYTKLSLGLPAVIFVGFALQQYGKERRLKEEYEFKSAISLSLEAYRGLVDDAIERLTPEERVKFADFLISSISIIFESPTERVFGTRRLGGPTDTKIIASAMHNAKEIIDMARPK